MIYRMPIRRFPVLLVLWLVVGPLGTIVPAGASQSVLDEDVTQGDRLEVRNFRGSIRVVTWDQSRLRVEADHPGDEEILLERRGSRWLLVPASWARDSGDFAIRLPGMARVRVEGSEPPAVDLVVSMPAHMPLVAESPHASIRVEGAESTVELTSMGGDLTVVGGSGSTHLTSMTGKIEIRGTRGRVTAEGALGTIEVSEVGGELRIETTRGDIVLEALRTTDLDATSLDGNIELRGPLAPGARYDLSTHGGDVELSVAGDVDAHFSVRAFRGSFETDLEIDPPPTEDHAEFTLGDGSARVRLESFSGRIRIDRGTGHATGLPPR